jgi:hypothetical protein
MYAFLFSSTHAVCPVYLLLGSVKMHFIKVKVKLSLLLKNEGPRQEDVWESVILNGGTRWKLAVSYMPLSLYPQGNGPRCALGRRLSGP